MLGREALEQEIRAFEKDGVVDLNDLLQGARRKNHPLNEQFEWIDSKAAHLYRLQQAAALVRRVVHAVEVAPNQMRLVRTYISRPEDRLDAPHVYTRRTIVLSDETDRLDYLIDVVERAHGNLESTGAAELEPLVQMTEQALRNLQRERDGLSMSDAAE